MLGYSVYQLIPVKCDINMIEFLSACGIHMSSYIVAYFLSKNTHQIPDLGGSLCIEYVWHLRWTATQS